MREEKVPNRDYFVRDDGTIRLTRGKITRGYCTLAGYYNCRGLIHRFVAKAFVHNPRPDIFTVVDHIDHNRKNNHYTNLRWVSKRFNKLNKQGRCLKVNKRRKGLTYTAVAKGVKQATFDTELEALQYTAKEKEKYFEQVYQEELKSEPKFKNVAVQTDL